jgi:hypothetical protein
MEFMLLFIESRDTPKGGGNGFAEMNQFARDLASQKKLRRGAPLAEESASARVEMRGGQALVSDGPFAETKEVLGGFWIVEVAGRDEAIDIARRCPHAQYGIVEVHPVRWRDAVADPGAGVPFLFAFRQEPGLKDADGSKLREMIAFGDGLKGLGKFIETAPLALDPPPARLESQAGNIVITDGPFAETKEGVGGYALVRVGGRTEAVEVAKRYPHAKWGAVEVREILFFDET